VTGEKPRTFGQRTPQLQAQKQISGA